MMLPEGGHEAAQPIIDLDNTVIVQFVLFLVMLALLHYLVFKPYLQARAEREDRIDGERKRAREMEESAKARITEFEGKLEKAKQQGIQLRDQARAEAARKEREILDRARAETAQLVESQQLAVNKSADAARMKLRIAAEQWGQKLASRILGREVA